MMWGQARASRGVMGVDTRMIAGVRACLTFAPDRSSPTIQPTPHYDGALTVRLPASSTLVSLTASVGVHRGTKR